MQDELFGRAVGEFVLRDRIGGDGKAIVWRMPVPASDAQLAPH